MSLPEEVQNAIKSLVKVDASIKELENALKKYKEKKQELQKIIEGHMRHSNVKTIKLKNSKLQTYTRKTRPGVTKKWISERLKTYCEEKQINYDEIFDFIYNPIYRPQIEKQSFKKTKSKKTNNN